MAKPLSCAILGGSGYLGSYLTETLSARGHAVCVFDRNNPHEQWPDLAAKDIEWQQGDFLNEHELRRAVAGRDVVYHLICTTPSESNRDVFTDMRFNVIGTLNLLELGRRREYGKLVFVSSGGYVYGMARNLPIDETHPTEPLSAYGISKLTNEKYIRLYHSLYGLEYCILRFGNVFGARQPTDGSHGVISVFLNKVLRGDTIEIQGDGSVVRDYVHVADVTDALVRAATYRGEDALFNIGTGVGRSINDIVEAISRVSGLSLERRYLSGRPLDVPANILNATKAKRLLGWEACVPFDEGIASTLKWLRKQSQSVPA
jgi:UDP-glucose 4-epimerase